MSAVQLSVIMPVYNGEEFLAEAVESVLEQSFSDFEFLIVDDASTDATASLLEAYAKKDSRVRVVRNEENLGIANSLNNALSLAEGEFVARMDADDVCVAGRFEKQVAALADADVVGSWVTVVDSSGEELFVRTYPTDVSSRILRECPLAHPAVMFRKLVVVEAGGYDASLSTSQDYDLWLRLFSRGARLVNLQESLLLYRVHAGSVKNAKVKETLRNTLAIKKKARREYGLTFTARDWIRVAVESVALLLPAKLVMWVFLKKIGGGQ